MSERYQQRRQWMRQPEKMPAKASTCLAFRRHQPVANIRVVQLLLCVLLMACSLILLEGATSSTPCPVLNIQLNMPVAGFGAFESASLSGVNNNLDSNAKIAFLAAIATNNQLNAAGTPPVYGTGPIPLTGIPVHWQGSCFTLNVLPYFIPILADDGDEMNIAGRTILAEQLCFSDMNTPPQIMSAIDTTLGNSLLYTSLALACNSYNISTISSLYNDLNFSNKQLFPYSARGTIRLDVPNQMLLSMMQQFKWNRAVVIAADDPTVPPLVAQLQTEANSANVNLLFLTYPQTSVNCSSLIQSALQDDRRIFFFLGPFLELNSCLLEVIVVRQLLTQNYVLVVSLDTYGGGQYTPQGFAMALNISQTALKGAFFLSPVITQTPVAYSFVYQEAIMGLNPLLLESPNFVVLADAIALANQGITGLIGDRLKTVVPIVENSTLAKSAANPSNTPAQTARTLMTALLNAFSVNGAVGSYTFNASLDNTTFSALVPFSSMRYDTKEVFFFFTNASGLSLESTVLGNVLHGSDGDALLSNGVYNFDGVNLNLIFSNNMVRNQFSVVSTNVTWSNPLALKGINNNIPPDRAPTTTISINCIQCAAPLLTLSPAQTIYGALPMVNIGYQLNIQQDDLVSYNLNPICDGTAPVTQSVLPLISGLSSDTVRSSPVVATAASSTVSIYAPTLISTVQGLYQASPTSFAVAGKLASISSYSALAAITTANSIITAVDAANGAFNVEFLINCNNIVNNVSAVLRVAIQPQQNIYTPAVAAQDGIIALSVFGLVLASFLAFAVVKHRDERAIFSSSFMFLVIILLGFALLFMSSLLGIVTATAAVCQAKAITFHFGFTLALGSIFVKTYRLHRIFNSKNLLNMSISAWNLLTAVAGLLIVDAVLMALWIEVGGFGIESAAKPHCYASGISGSLIPAIFSVIKGVILLTGIYLTFKVRAVPANFNESRFIAVVIYNTTVLAGVYIVVFFGFSLNPNSLSIFTSVMTLLGSMLCMCIFYAPKLLALTNLYLKNDSSSGSARSSAGRGRKEKDMERERQRHRVAQTDTTISQVDFGPDLADEKAQGQADPNRSSTVESVEDKSHDKKQRTVDSVSRRLKGLKGKYLSAAMNARRANAEHSRLLLRAAEVRRLAEDYYDELRTLVVDIRLNNERLKKMTAAAAAHGNGGEDIDKHMCTVNELEKLIDLPIQQIQYDEQTSTYTVLESPRAAALSTSKKPMPLNLNSPSGQPQSGSVLQMANAKKDQAIRTPIQRITTINQSPSVQNRNLHSPRSKNSAATASGGASSGPSASPLATNRTITSPQSQSEAISHILLLNEGERNVPPLALLPLQQTSSAADLSLTHSSSTSTPPSRRDIGTARLAALNDLQGFSSSGPATTSNRRGSDGLESDSGNGHSALAMAAPVTTNAYAGAVMQLQEMPLGVDTRPPPPKGPPPTNSNATPPMGLLSFLQQRGAAIRRNVI